MEEENGRLRQQLLSKGSLNLLRQSLETALKSLERLTGRRVGRYGADVVDDHTLVDYITQLSAAIMHAASELERRPQNTGSRRIMENAGSLSQKGSRSSNQITSQENRHPTPASVELGSDDARSRRSAASCGPGFHPIGLSATGLSAKGFENRPRSITRAVLCGTGMLKLMPKNQAPITADASTRADS
ncbi:hypothetical protein GNI_114230 [Gregarina niphandrodes]|uniref:Uncharacterized protein n=1 Tax=Gregarina niphandrodes TaxID=110365 RepID=A0A023B3H7_GRENI|nr:hypothetical protein GNI_114230 [Gregarina niphandrodes]EZG55352.1 hypothetical protein GNI_114230 [Gregarina niphandrodes]|eukprot:XP_011131618.1 hypothetical protein GNI_114230 [Gregarina niphandrodes]